MNVVIWARVSSTEQKEGYSIDAQLRATRDKAQREGWQIVREFAVAESARRGTDREAFNQMLSWVKRNARKEEIGAILAHKLDRACRNMRDAVRLQELEDGHGVRLSLLEGQFGDGPAGALSFNVMAAVAQYYSDNLRTEVNKGMAERVKQGWPVGRAPYGYQNVPGDREQPILVDPEQARAVTRIFELYSSGNMSFRKMSQQLADEGHVYRPSQTRFSRTSVSYILNNRYYIGEIKWHGQAYPGKHRPLVDHGTFRRCQDLLSGKNHRTSSPGLPYSGGLFRCAYCGHSITAERIPRKLKDGSVRHHVYYKCSDPVGDHPNVRWRLADLEQAIVEDLGKLRMPTQEIAAWFREALKAAVDDATVFERQQRRTLAKRRSELRNMEDRLLNAYLAGMLDEDAFNAKAAELKCEAAEVAASLANLDRTVPPDGELAVRLFDWTQKLPEIWLGSNITARREILEAICSNRTLTDVSLCLAKRKPFDILAERPSVQIGTPCRIQTCDFWLRRPALYSLS